MKLLKYKFAIIIQILVHYICIAQSGKIDSLRKAAASSKDSIRLLNLSRLSEIYTYMNSDSTILYATAAYNEAVKLNYPHWMGWPLFRLGIAEFHKGYFPKAEQYFRQSIPFAKKYHNAPMLAGLYSYLAQALASQGDYRKAIPMFDTSCWHSEKYNDIIGISIQTALLSHVYRALGDYMKAFNYSRETIRLIEKAKDTLQMAVWATNITGNLYRDAGEYTKAIGYYHETIQNANKLQIPATAYKLLGQTYCQLKEYDSALYYYRQLVKSREVTGDPSIKKFQLQKDSLDIGEVYIAQRQYDQSLRFFSGELEYFLKRNALPEVVQILINMGKIYNGKNDPALALSYACRGLALAQKIEARPFIRDGCQLLSVIYDQQSNTDSAYLYYRRYVTVEKSLIDDQFKRVLALKEMKEAEEKNLAKISFLSQEKRKQLTLFTAAVLVGLLLAFFIARSMILKRRKEHLQHLMTAANAQLEQKKKAQQLIELQQKATELEMHALRAQMNPHFIFNSLNSINRFILQNNKSQASEYLTKFSRLVRLILQNSQAPLIPLESELESLQLYLELEAVRFDNHFDFKISIEEDLDISALKIPPLIIQPYAENAIWHGLMHKEEKGCLEVKLFQQDDLLCCKITDDGIGRKKAAELKSKSGSTHKSMGMKITASRIEMLQQKKQLDAYIKITDLVLPDGTVSGTEVLLKIPVCYD